MPPHPGPPLKIARMRARLSVFSRERGQNATELVPAGESKDWEGFGHSQSLGDGSRPLGMFRLGILQRAFSHFEFAELQGVRLKSSIPTTIKCSECSAVVRAGSSVQSAENSAPCRCRHNLENHAKLSGARIFRACSSRNSNLRNSISWKTRARADH